MVLCSPPPAEIVEATRSQMQSITRMQIQTMDHIMDAWEEQIKASNQMGGSPSAILPKLKSSAGYGQAGNWPKADTFQIAAMNPLQFWMQFAEQWQKASADAMAFWAKASKSDTVGLRRR